MKQFFYIKLFVLLSPAVNIFCTQNKIVSAFHNKSIQNLCPIINEKTEIKFVNSSNPNDTISFKTVRDTMINNKKFYLVQFTFEEHFLTTDSVGNLIEWKNGSLNYYLDINTRSEEEWRWNCADGEAIAKRKKIKDTAIDSVIVVTFAKNWMKDGDFEFYFFPPFGLLKIETIGNHRLCFIRVQ
jgi:hypothetical protein